MVKHILHAFVELALRITSYMTSITVYEEFIVKAIGPFTILEDESIPGLIVLMGDRVFLVAYGRIGWPIFYLQFGSTIYVDLDEEDVWEELLSTINF